MHAVVVVAQLMLRVIGFLGWKSQENRSKAPEVHYPEFFLMKAATDIILSPVENYALVMYGCLLIQNRLHMNLYTVAHLCSMNICGMISCGGLLSE